MPGYIGNEPLLGQISRERFTGDGTTTAFTLSRTVGTADGLLVQVSGVMQDSTTYTVVGKTLTFQDAPPSAVSGQPATNIEVVYLIKLGTQQVANWNIPIVANSGTADVLVAAFNPAITALTQNLMVNVVMSSPNTGTTPTINPNGLGALPIVNDDGSAVSVGQLTGTIRLRYESSTSNWRLLSTVVGSQAAQFDNSNRLATTSFVQSMLGNNTGQVLISTSTTLTAAAHAGRTVLLGGSSGINVTLPSVSTCPVGTRIHFYNGGAGTATLLRAGTDLIAVNIGTVTSMTVFTGDTLVLESNGAGYWYSVNGSAQLPNSSSFGRNLAASGYQKLPGGLILQWMIINTPAASTAVGTLPISFPNNFFGVVASGYGASFASGNNAFMAAVPNGLSQVTVQSTYSASSVSIQVWCVGN